MPVPSPALTAELRRILGDDLLVDAAARAVYARDASHLRLGTPLAVALPRTAAAAAATVAACARHGVPVTCRGGGTGLAGGAVPAADTVVLALGRLTQIGAVADGATNLSDRRIRSAAGVFNESVSRHVAAAGLQFAPDPGSQAAATIGGNIATNAGGPHCLRHGVTLQHVLRMEWIDACGRCRTTGHGLPSERGIDLRTLLCGSEGTLGVVTAADLRLVATPAAVSTLLAFFLDLADGSRAVGAVLRAGLLPVAVEMVDAAMLAAVEAAFGFGFPTDVAGAMIVELTGETQEVAEDAVRVGDLLLAAGAREVRTARDDAERAELWRCRKQAFGAVGRLAPSYVSMDVVVPVGDLPGLVAEIRTVQREHGVEIATVFHAGDGNLHPGIHHDDRDRESGRRAHAAADAILAAALRRDGSITGEHGVGIEKLHAVPWQVDAEAARLMRGVKAVFDPRGLLNPGKKVPGPEVPVVWAQRPPLPRAVQVRPEHLVVTAPADAPVAEVQRAALEHGLWLPIGVWLEPGGSGAAGKAGLGRAGTIGELLDQGGAGPALLAARMPRDVLLEVWASDGAGRAFHAGAPVAKNVAGYDLARLLCGAGGSLARIDACTLQLRPMPERAMAWRFVTAPAATVPWEVAGAVMSVVGSWNDEMASPVLVVEGDASGITGSLVVFAAGRDRAWDLERRERDLVRAAGRLGPPRVRRSVPFAGAGTLLDPDLLPAWALAGPDWTCWQPDPAVADRALPWRHGGGRHVWQAWPRCLWLPRAAGAAPAGWCADVLWTDDRLQPPPPPAAGVPHEVLAGLKRLFDPEGRLPGFPWLLPHEVPAS
ncbi:MAG: FAD-linked oxidase C-terminal domain-containing protein [Candidatus Krumholzibacteriia bacterium]